MFSTSYGQKKGFTPRKKKIIKNSDLNTGYLKDAIKTLTTARFVNCFYFGIFFCSWFIFLLGVKKYAFLARGYAFSLVIPSQL